MVGEDVGVTVALGKLGIGASLLGPFGLPLAVMSGIISLANSSNQCNCRYRENDH
jgi:hypothetical protein